MRKLALVLMTGLLATPASAQYGYGGLPGAPGLNAPVMQGLCCTYDDSEQREHDMRVQREFEQQQQQRQEDYRRRIEQDYYDDYNHRNSLNDPYR